MTAEFYNEYLTRRSSCSGCSTHEPEQISRVWCLMRYHEERGDKIIIFSDNVIALRSVPNKLQVPMSMVVSSDERMQVRSRSLTIDRCAYDDHSVSLVW